MKIYSFLPQPLSTYSPSEPTISIPTLSEPHNSEPNTPSSPSHKFNLETTTLLLSEARDLNESISPPSSTLSSPPYYNISSNSEQPEIPDPQSPTLAQLQATTLSEQHPSVPETFVPSPFEP